MYLYKVKVLWKTLKCFGIVSKINFRLIFEFLIINLNVIFYILFFKETVYMNSFMYVIEKFEKMVEN